MRSDATSAAAAVPPYRPAPLLPEMAAVAGEADAALLTLVGRGESRYALYSLLRQTVARVVRCDSFYVGFCGEGQTVVFPYNYDGAEFDDPNINPWRPGGLTEWIVTQRRPYWFGLDGGDLLHRGRPFGDTARLSADAVAVPLLAPAGAATPRKRRQAIGLLSLLSYVPNAYTPQTVRLLECLAESLMVALEREQEDRERRQRFQGAKGSGAAPELTPSGAVATSSVAEVVAHLSERLRAIRRRAESIRDTPPQDDTFCAGLDALCRACEQAQTDAYELLLRTAATGNTGAVPVGENPLTQLTPREAEIAALIAAGLSNREIGSRLFISEKTAKTHCANIIRKLSVGGRSGVAVLLRPYIPLPLSTPLE